MKKLCLLALLVFSFPCLAASADEYEENPDGPNGYRATCFKTHYHGNWNGPTQECNGYEATAIRSRYGLNPLLTPKSEESDGWGDRGSSNGGGFLSRRFGGNANQSAGGDQWMNHFRNQQQGNQASGAGMTHPAEQMAGAMLTANALQRYRMNRGNPRGGTSNGGSPNPYAATQGGFGGGSPNPYAAAHGGFGGGSPNPYAATQGGFGGGSPNPYAATQGGFGGGSPNPYAAIHGGFGGPNSYAAIHGGFGGPNSYAAIHGGFGGPNSYAAIHGGFGGPNSYAATQGGFGGSPNPYAATHGGYRSNSPTLNQYAANGSALQHAVGATPLRNLLRNSQGGFNRVYATQ